MLRKIKDRFEQFCFLKSWLKKLLNSDESITYLKEKYGYELEHRCNSQTEVFKKIRFKGSKVDTAKPDKNSM